MPSVLETRAEDELFRLPLSEFTAARNALAAKLKKDGDSAESDRIKALSKPPVSAWARVPAASRRSAGRAMRGGRPISPNRRTPTDRRATRSLATSDAAA